jgi:hypothetical protein
MNFRINHIARIAQGAWLVACAFVLVGFLYCRGNGEAQDFLTWTMQVLSFPLGLIALPLIIVTGFLAQMISPLGSLLTMFGDYVMVWFWFFVLGFIQWFLIVPGIVKLVRFLFGRARGNDPE